MRCCRMKKHNSTCTSRCHLSYSLAKVYSGYFSYKKMGMFMKLPYGHMDNKTKFKTTLLTYFARKFIPSAFLSWFDNLQLTKEFALHGM